MAIWLFRAGSYGEYEQRFLDEGRIYLTWTDLNIDLGSFNEQRELYEYLLDHYSIDKVARARNWTGQIWPIAHTMELKDWVVLPSKSKSSIHIGEITGPYCYDSRAENPFFHYRSINWFATDIPRSAFDQDLLYSFGAFMTVCRIQRNDAEIRIRKMAQNRWARTEIVPGFQPDATDTEAATAVDVEQYSGDIIAEYIGRKYKGHGMVRIVEAILKAKGFSTYRSPEGPDKGVDLLAAPDALGFGSPKICIQVKTTDAAVDRPTLDQLIGTMHNFKADYGVLVSWSGFKSSVDKERAAQFFKVRLWDSSDIIREFLNHYEQLDEDLKAEIPLKRIWALANIDE